jgi:type III pantothenate kinase
VQYHQDCVCVISLHLHLKITVTIRRFFEFFIGRSTRSIHSGVINGVVYENDGFIDEYKSLSNYIIILTGGDTEFLAKRLKKYHICQFKFSIKSLKPNFSI